MKKKEKEMPQIHKLFQGIQVAVRLRNIKTNEITELHLIKTSKDNDAITLKSDLTTDKKGDDEFFEVMVKNNNPALEEDYSVSITCSHSHGGVIQEGGWDEMYQMTHYKTKRFRFGEVISDERMNQHVSFINVTITATGKMVDEYIEQKVLITHPCNAPKRIPMANTILGSGLPKVEMKDFGPSLIGMSMATAKARAIEHGFHVRVLNQNDFMTLEYRPHRINLYTDEENNVEKWTEG